MPGASPKAISGRTRYLQVWLAFHSYPQVIPSVFNLSGFGPPRGLTPASACPWIDHLASRLRRATRVALFGLAVAAAGFHASPRRAPQLAGSFYKRHAVTATRAAPTACGHAVSGAVSLPSRGAFHLSLTVLVHYRSQESVQAWRVVPPASHRVSRVRRYSGTCRPWMDVRVRGPSPVSPAFPCRSARASMDICAGPATPRAQCAPRFGLVPVRSPLLGESRLISLPPGTEMFQFSGLPPSGICVLPEVRGDGPPRVRPFGDLRVKEHVPLAAAYRSLSRPSSASCAKASTVRPYHLHIGWLGYSMLLACCISSDQMLMTFIEERY